MRPFSLLLIVLALSACGGEGEDVNIRLTMDERERVDDLTVAHMDSLRPLRKAECAENFEDRVAVATDSIVQRLLEEEVRLRARIPQNLRNDR
jgi:hypothetical protein